MKTFVIKKEHLDKDNFYVGSENLENFDGNIEAVESLGYVRFKKNLKANGFIYFKAGSGIEAGSGISCKLILKAKLRIFAGLCLWRKPTENELKITCGKLESGQVCYGTLIETGLPEEKVSRNH